MPEASEDEAVQNLQEFVVQEIKAGADKATIAHRLTEMGVERHAATELVEALYPEIMRAAREEEFSGSAWIPAIGGALGAAAAGGIVWGLLVIGTGYEVGFVAWGLGWLSGMAVVTLSGGKKGPQLQVLAVLSSVLGIAIGKYLAFFHFLKEHVGEEYGAEVAAELSMFSAEMAGIFVENASTILNGFDVLWVILAVLTAWRIPKSLGITPPPAYESV